MLVAKSLVRSKKVRHGLFFIHLTIEKILKALICKNTYELAPPIHNLIRLAKLSGINMNQDQIHLLTELNPFNIQGRYPELLMPPPALEEARKYLKRTGEIYIWLKNQL